MVTKSAVIGIDLGASDSYVAYVGKGVVDVVQNEVSKRSTPTLVGFTDRERLLGDAALASIKSNAKNTCRNFKHLMGRKLEASDVEKEHFWSTSKLATTEDGFSGYDITFKGEGKAFSATEITAMYLTKLREITESWCQAKVADIVVSCPSYFADVQRQALLDAASIAGLSVLRVMNEHTATALAYGIYRSNDFDPDKPMTVAFCSFGHSLFSVAIVQFVRGKLRILCEKSDKVGGRDLDECLMREFAQQFSKKVKGADVLANKKAAFKLEDAVTKTKKILSANSEAAISVEFLMEDEDFASSITRAEFEQMCEPVKARCKAVLDAAIAECASNHNVAVEQIDSVEVIGGSSRVPWFKQLCSEAFGGKSLSTTMNAEESVARGCALQAAMLSPLYKVRDFKVDDSTNFGINVGWTGVSEAPPADAEMESQADLKAAPIFPPGTTQNMLKILTFWRKRPFELIADYVDEKVLLPGTPKALGKFRIDMPELPEAKRVKVKTKLTQHGTFAVEGATIVEEEEFEETVKEKRELPPDPEEDKEEEDEASKEDAPEKSPSDKEGDKEAAPDASPDNEGEVAADEHKEDDKENKDGGADVEKDAAEKKAPEKKKEAKKKKEPKYEWVSVVKKKKRTKKTEVPVIASGRPGLTDEALQVRKDAESRMQAEMKEIIETDERKNDLESFIFASRNKLSGAWEPFMSEKDREKFSADLTKAEDWLYDTFDATKIQYIEKLEELKSTSAPVEWRVSEDSMRPEWVSAVEGTVKNYCVAAESPGDKYGHIAAEKLAKIVEECKKLESWLAEMKGRQSQMPKYEKPLLLCADMEKKNQDLAKMADDILKEPKPAPPKPEKKEEVIVDDKDAADGENGKPETADPKGDVGGDDSAKPEAGAPENPDEEEENGMEVD